jgi:uncharacterized membrane protein
MNTKPKKINNAGQAAVEYIFILLFSVMLMVKIVDVLSSFIGGSVGNLGHVLSVNLRVGVCKNHCFFGGYKNGYDKR